MAKLDYNSYTIDLLKLYTESSTEKWNLFLQDCFNSRSINRLMLTRIGLQKGMDDLVRKKLNTEKMNEWYIRLNRSVELTAKKIINELHPLPGDNPFTSKEFKNNKWLEAKRKRDQEFDKFLARSAW